MILQCDQCQTKFRLDDSKLKPGGVKVRCSKCRHVFIAGADVKPEESDFDALLSGLGAPAPEAHEEPQAAPAPAPEPFEPALSAAAEHQEEPADAAAAPVPEPHPAAEPEVSASDFPDFSSFDFAPEPAAGEEPAPAPEPAPEMNDFSAFEFGPEEETPHEQAQTEPAAQELDFGEFSFTEEPAVPASEPAGQAPGKDEFDFGEFPFQEEPAAPAAEHPEAAPGEGLGFGEFEFNAEPLAQAQEAAPAAPAPDLDFGEFTFQEEPVLKGGEQTAAAAESFDFDEEPPPLKEPPVAEEHDAFAFSEEPQTKGAPVPPQPDEEFSLGNFSFEEGEGAFGKETAAEEPTFPGAVPSEPAGKGEKETAGAEPGAAGIAAGALFGAAAGAAAFGAAKAKHEQEEAPVAEAEPHHESPLDFSFGGPIPTRVPGYMGEDEELPPLSISSRRKGRSAVFITAATVSILAVVALSGAGLYLLQSGPAAAEKFDKLHLGFVGKWFGVETPEEGRIEVKNPLASFVQNKEAGELFVVQGQALNTYKKARASIHVKVSIFDKKGAVIMQKTAYCGNRLTNDQLATLPMARIEAIQNNQFGDSLSNLGVKPGQSINFVVALANVPKDAADFGVEVVGSTVGQ